MLDHDVGAVLAAYPTIHAACRRRDVRDPRSGRRISTHLAGLLEHLDPVAPIAVGDLAERLGVTPATASLQLSRLGRLRLITRTRDERDARRVQLRLTDAGARVREARTLLDPERVRAVLPRLPAPDREAVVAGLRLLAGAAGQIPEASPSRSRRTPER